MPKKILTIVVPTYNAEKYLLDNLKSFELDEVLDHIEVLIINDGSTDNSLTIAEEYVSRYPDTYKVITKENGGHGSGINCGIKYAQGTYFKVVDADDWVDANAFVGLVNYLRESKSDIIYSGFFWVYDRGGECKENFEKKAEFSKPFKSVIYNKEYVFDEVAGDNLYIKMHNMTIKTSILQDYNITIDEHCYYVDAEYITYPIPYIETIAFIEDFVYFYRIGSLGQSVGIERMQKNQENYNKVLNSLFGFYKQLGLGIPCTVAKKKYIARVIARIVAGKIKIILSFPASKCIKEELITFDNNLKRNFPEIYYSNINNAVRLLRKTNYMIYRTASKLVQKKY